MANLENVIEEKLKDNRQIHDVMVRKIKEDEEEISLMVLKISKSGDVRDIISKLILLSCDIQAVESLDSNYHELLDMK